MFLNPGSLPIAQEEVVPVFLGLAGQFRDHSKSGSLSSLVKSNDDLGYPPDLPGQYKFQWMGNMYASALEG
jgi:hypothetical protein